MDALIHGRIDEWTDHAWTDGRTDGQAADLRTDRWMDGGSNDSFNAISPVYISSTL